MDAVQGNTFQWILHPWMSRRGWKGPELKHEGFLRVWKGRGTSRGGWRGWEPEGRREGSSFIPAIGVLFLWDVVAPTLHRIRSTSSDLGPSEPCQEPREGVDTKMKPKKALQ